MTSDIFKKKKNTPEFLNFLAFKYVTFSKPCNYLDPLQFEKKYCKSATHPTGPFTIVEQPHDQETTKFGVVWDLQQHSPLPG